VSLLVTRFAWRLGLPPWDSEVHVIIATTKTTVDEWTARLVSQLVFQATEERKITKPAKA
jgi:hypothetical protein